MFLLCSPKCLRILLVAQADHKVVVLLSQPPEGCDSRRMLPDSQHYKISIWVGNIILMHLETIYIRISLSDYSFLHEESPTHTSTPTANIDVHEYMWSFVKMQVVTQWVCVEGLRLSIRDGCSGSEAQVMGVMSSMDAVKQCIYRNSKQTSSTVTFCLKQPTLWKPQFQMSSLLCVPRHPTYFIWNDSHSISKYKGEANSLENTMQWVATSTGYGQHRHL